MKERENAREMGHETPRCEPIFTRRRELFCQNNFRLSLKVEVKRAKYTHHRANYHSSYFVSYLPRTVQCYVMSFALCHTCYLIQ